MENKLKTKNVWNMRCNKIVNLDEFTGGSTNIYYNKYIKYKNKYMILKRSMNV
jgi:hypothetical protein